MRLTFIAKKQIVPSFPADSNARSPVDGSAAPGTIERKRYECKTHQAEKGGDGIALTAAQPHYQFFGRTTEGQYLGWVLYQLEEHGPECRIFQQRIRFDPKLAGEKLLANDEGSAPSSRPFDMVLPLPTEDPVSGRDSGQTCGMQTRRMTATSGGGVWGAINYRIRKNGSDEPCVAPENAPNRKTDCSCYDTSNFTVVSALLEYSAVANSPYRLELAQPGVRALHVTPESDPMASEAICGTEPSTPTGDAWSWANSLGDAAFLRADDQLVSTSYCSSRGLSRRGYFRAFRYARGGPSAELSPVWRLSPDASPAQPGRESLLDGDGQPAVIYSRAYDESGAGALAYFSIDDAGNASGSRDLPTLAGHGPSRNEINPLSVAQAFGSDPSSTCDDVVFLAYTVQGADRQDDHTEDGEFSGCRDGNTSVPPDGRPNPTKFPNVYCSTCPVGVTDCILCSEETKDSYGCFRCATRKCQSNGQGPIRVRVLRGDLGSEVACGGEAVLAELGPDDENRKRWGEADDVSDVALGWTQLFAPGKDVNGRTRPAKTVPKFPRLFYHPDGYLFVTYALAHIPGDGTDRRCGGDGSEGSGTGTLGYPCRSEGPRRSEDNELGTTAWLEVYRVER